MELTNQKIKHTELGDWTTSGSHSILLPEEGCSHSCSYLLVQPGLNFVVKVMTVTKIHNPKGRYIS